MLIESVWGAVSSFIVYCFGLILAVKLAKHFQCSPKRALVICLWHTLFCLLYTLYVLKHGGDAYLYFEMSQTWGKVESPLNYNFVGTGFIVTFLTPLTQWLGFSFLSVSLLFHIMGFVGLLSFDSALREVSRGKGPILVMFSSLFVFLPSLNFWTSSVGKDSIAFMALGLIVKSAIDIRNRVWLMVPAILLLLLIRPHMAGLVIVAFVLAVIFNKQNSLSLRMQNSLSLRILCTSGAIVFALVSLPFVMRYVGFNELPSFSEVANYIAMRQSQNTGGGGGFDVASMSLFNQLFSYMFRPLPFEANNLPALAASLDNMILLAYVILFLSYAICGLYNKSSNDCRNRVFFFIYCLLGWSILAMTTANLGISVRQKWMIVPFLLLLLLPKLARSDNQSVV